MNIVIVYGPQASGKTRRASQLLKHFKCTRLVDDWNRTTKLRDGDLALTTDAPPFNVEGAKVFSIGAAKAALAN